AQNDVEGLMEERFYDVVISLTSTPTVTDTLVIFPTVGYGILSFLTFINTEFSVFNNGLVIAVMLRNTSLLQPMNILILSLAVSDLMIALCGSLVATITNYQGSYFIGHATCVFQGFSVNYFGKDGTLNGKKKASKISVFGFRGIKSGLSMRRSVQGLLFVWVFCLFWAVALLLSWSSYSLEGVQTNTSYLILYSLLCFIVPVAIIIYCYFHVLKSLRKVDLCGRSRKSENDHAITMVLAMITAFFVCWLPYAVVVVVNPELRVPPLIATLPMYFAKTSPVYNPIIYFFSNKQVNGFSLLEQGELSVFQEQERQHAQQGVASVTSPQPKQTRCHC
uniref:G-protein coupled receptors family 1 profile domain-containing protein n=1 Tax=Xiphophorus couchianus TaxID=32473 RepID=A0A3B5MU09_9TELE